MLSSLYIYHNTPPQSSVTVSVLYLQYASPLAHHCPHLCSPPLTSTLLPSLWWLSNSSNVLPSSFHYGPLSLATCSPPHLLPLTTALTSAHHHTRLHPSVTFAALYLFCSCPIVPSWHSQPIPLVHSSPSRPLHLLTTALTFTHL